MACGSLCFILTACSGGSGGSGTPSPAGKSVAQFASVIAQYRPDISGGVATADEKCRVLLADCVNQAINPLVPTLTRFGEQLSSLGSSPDDVPAEIDFLFHDTVSKAAASLQAVQALEHVDCANLRPSSTCIHGVAGFVTAGDALVRTLRGWDPYL